MRFGNDPRRRDGNARHTVIAPAARSWGGRFISWHSQMGMPDTTANEHPLRSVELKIQRGETLARNLAESIAEWLARSPLIARAEFVANRFGYRLILEPFKEPPLRDEWGLLIGDCVHNLRIRGVEKLSVATRTEGRQAT
jgi:hypothetical protein